MAEKLGHRRFRNLIEQLKQELTSSMVQKLQPGFDLNEIATGVTSDSTQVKPGYIFVAIPGISRDGHDFIADALTRGARLVIAEKEAKVPTHESSLIVKDSRLTISFLAAEFYRHPSREMMMIGITGTSGKTTTSYLCESILASAGHKVGVIGTVNYRYQDKIIDATHTTPDPVELQRILREMRDAGCSAVVMEVSSHALKQKRTYPIAFDGMIFTNLSPEHLDFHSDMEDYFQSKCILFTEYPTISKKAAKRSVFSVNADDAYGARLLDLLHRLRHSGKIGYSNRVQKPDYYSGSELEVSILGIRGWIEGQKGKIRIESPLIGDFNVSNILAAVGLADQLRIPGTSIERGIKSLLLVPGRLQMPEPSNSKKVFVDYAHKPDALQKVLETLNRLRESSPKESRPKLITVFGCGGDRDRKKRPVMGKIATDLSDWVIVTSDNPRTEDPAQIISEILAGISEKKNLQVEPDRKKAIFEAIRKAEPGDLLLIAGKGHEDYQIIADPSSKTGTVKIHFDDREIAREGLSQKSG